MDRKKVGLALSGGGARGFAHVGVIKVLAEHNIKIDYIAGTSAGSVVGAALACGMTADELVSFAGKFGWFNTMRPSFSISGLLSTAPMGKLLARELPCIRFEDLTIPLVIVAYDLVKNEEVIFKGTGDLVPAIRASCSVPGIFAPIRAGHRILVDGGVTSQMPVDVLREMGADIIIGADLLACGSTYPTNPYSALSILVRSGLTLIRTASREQARKADILIEPAIAHLRPDQISKRDEFIALGEMSARDHIDEILRAIV